MSRNTSIILGDHFAAFTEAQVASGRYTSTSEVVRAGLRLLEAQAQQLEALRQAIAEGEASGPPEPFDFDAFLASKRTSAA